MSLRLNETFRVEAPAALAWKFLKNPADVVTCLPGAELTETIDDHTYAGRVKVKVGPVTAAYAGRATLTHVDDAAHEMQMVGEGKESGGTGSARMTLTGKVTSLGEHASEVSVDATIDIAGRVMQFGRGLIESVNKQLFRQFAESVQQKLAAAHAEQSTAGSQDTSDGSAEADPSASHHAPLSAPLTTPADLRVPASPAAPPPAATPRAPATNQSQELRLLPLLFKAIGSWLRGLFRSRR
ncbi:MAG: SRPBCC family protein [Gemmatimonadaceae bacterium]